MDQNVQEIQSAIYLLEKILQKSIINDPNDHISVTKRLKKLEVDQVIGFAN